MFSWYYGRQKKLEYEKDNKITVENLNYFLSQSDIQRVPGLCFFYSGIQDGMTPVFGHYLNNMRSMHEVIIFTTLKYIMVPKVDPRERFTIRRIGLKGIYGCLVCYGYADSLNPDGDDFVTLVTEALKAYMGRCADEPSSISTFEEVEQLEEAKAVGVVHVHGKTRFYIGKKTSWSERVLLRFYEFLHSNCRSALPTLDIPLQRRMEIGMLCNV